MARGLCVIRKKKRTKAQRERLKWKQRAPIGIGETRDEQKARRHEIEVAVIQAVRAHIWATRPCCQVCGGRRDSEGHPDEMHEEPPRSKTRGLPPEQRFNLIVCGRLCWPCHRDVTESRGELVFDDATRGFMGGVRMVQT